MLLYGPCSFRLTRAFTDPIDQYLQKGCASKQEPKSLHQFFSILITPPSIHSPQIINLCSDIHLYPALSITELSVSTDFHRHPYRVQPICLLPRPQHFHWPPLPGPFLHKERSKQSTQDKIYLNMGCGPSKPAEDRDASHRSAAIDAQLRKDRSNARKEIKILLLGAGESGKSTLVKQMKCLWDQPYTQSERESYREVIFANTITSIQVVLDALPALQHITIPAEHGDAERIDLLLTLPPDSHDTPVWTPRWPTLSASSGLAPASNRLSHSAISINSTIRPHTTCFYFDNIIRIAQPGYIPTEQDIVRSRVKSTGISESKFNVGQLIWKVFDVGGQRSERKKWIHCFENVNVLIFFVAINEYDQVLYEDECVNRMAEAATLFDSICNSQWFRQTQMILFFNKIDLFKAKLLTSPLSSRFPDYDGDNSYESAAKFIHRNFLQLCRDPNKDIITHFTCATDSQQISVVLAGVQESILRKNLAAALYSIIMGSSGWFI
ncbi:hypothetical protein H4Q26_018224 [Puccinia striiformis f. sp. tritici PST-130]|nr:hypothetical protein H4Q26_018224 [Puccinia striiformis f. sp. tritici PST-130]